MSLHPREIPRRTTHAPGTAHRPWGCTGQDQRLGWHLAGPGRSIGGWLSDLTWALTCETHIGELPGVCRRGAA